MVFGTNPKKTAKNYAGLSCDVFSPDCVVEKWIIMPLFAKKEEKTIRGAG